MQPSLWAITAAAISMFSCLACGKSGSREIRPAEVLYFVSGASGTPFHLVDESTPRPECGNGNGIQALNANHQFGDREFRTPHLFVMENAFPPVRAVFAVPEENDLGIQVDLFLGQNLRAATSNEIAPGDCRTVGTDLDDTLQPMPTGRQVRVEVCSPGAFGAPSDEPCGAGTADANIAFFVNIGDQTAANVTGCDIRPVSEACRTPATFFVEEPQDSVSAVVTKFSDQDRDAILRVELYIDGALVDVASDSTNAVVEADI